jgi:glutamate-5-semialdehyde dehydrogenase
VGDLDDPLDEERPLGVRPNGLRVSKRRVPLGTVAVVYEARPNVTAEAAALCLRSGNAVVLRGGKEALGTNVALAACVRAGLVDAGLNPDAVQLLEDLDRARVTELLTATGLVQLAIPRGGAALMDFVDSVARVPVVRHGAGVCHVYVDASADLTKATEIAVNAKAQRPGVCNAAETLLVHRAVAREFLAVAGPALVAAGVRLRADVAAREALARAGVAAEAAVDADWDTEFLALTMAVKVVDHLRGALAHIAAHGTEHTAAIVAEDDAVAERFLREVDASCVLSNASTRFNDGGELGLGAEMGISTSRMHAWGPMGVRELTAEKFVVRGDGQVRR